MSSHPLKLLSLIALLGLLGSQLGLMIWLQTDYRYVISGLLAFPLLLPLRGIVTGRLYTYKWVGFLTLFYFCIGVSEAFANPEHRLYSTLTMIFSCLLFISSIYFSRYLRVKKSPE